MKYDILYQYLLRWIPKRTSKHTKSSISRSILELVNQAKYYWDQWCIWISGMAIQLLGDRIANHDQYLEIFYHWSEYFTIILQQTWKISTYYVARTKLRNINCYFYISILFLGITMLFSIHSIPLTKLFTSTQLTSLSKPLVWPRKHNVQ